MGDCTTQGPSWAGELALEACEECRRTWQDRAVRAEYTLIECLLALEKALPRWGATMLLALSDYEAVEPRVVGIVNGRWNRLHPDTKLTDRQFAVCVRGLARLSLAYTTEPDHYWTITKLGELVAEQIRARLLRSAE